MSDSQIRPSAVPTVRGMPEPPGKAEKDAIDSLSHGELVARYRYGVANFDQRLFTLDDELADTAFLPDAGVGNWPCRVLVGHLADDELSNAHRVRKILAEDKPMLQAWDENAFIDAGLYAKHASPIGGYVALIYTLRIWHSELLSSLEDGQWLRTGMHVEHGERSILDIVRYSTWHLERHAWYLNKKIRHMLGEPEVCNDTPKGKACGPSCGCHPAE